MTENSNLGRCFLTILCIYLFCFFCHDSSCTAAVATATAAASGQDGEGVRYNSFTISSFAYAWTKLQPYEWRYIRVDLPSHFSSMVLALESDVDIDSKSIRKLPEKRLPIICLREGSPPLPDIYNTSLTVLAKDSISNISFRGMPDLQFTEQCYSMQKNMSLTLTNEQLMCRFLLECCILVYLMALGQSGHNQR